MRNEKYRLNIISNRNKILRLSADVECPRSIYTVSNCEENHQHVYPYACQI